MVFGVPKHEYVFVCVESKMFNKVRFFLLLFFCVQHVIAGDNTVNVSVKDCRTQAEFADGKVDEDDKEKDIYTVDYWDAHVSDNSMKACIVAELKKRSGQYDAVRHYKKAIELNEYEPAYHIFLGDYYRNYRGPKQPLFDLSKHEYDRACQKLGLDDCRNGLELTGSGFSWQGAELDRGLIYLYEKDGIPLLNTRDKKWPVLSFSVQADYMNVTSDSDERDDIREFTSEAMLIESRTNNPARNLSLQERMDILRVKEVTESYGRIRVRPYSWSVIDLFYRNKQVKDAQITEFDARNDITQLRELEYNRLAMKEYGFSLEKLTGTEKLGDYSVKALFSKISRRGLIEYLPDAEESVNNFEVTAVGSRFFGRSKLDIEVSYVIQDITQKIASAQKRDRSIAAIRADYHLSSFVKKEKNGQGSTANYNQRFASRGVTLFGGVVTDRERFGPDKVINDNYFVGGSWKGIRPFTSMNVFDVSIQATIFTSDVQEEVPGRDRDNSQSRVGATIVYREIDEETNSWPPERRVLGIPFTSLRYVASVSDDRARKGRDYYENRSFGLKIIGKGYSRPLRATILGSVGIDVKMFTELNTTEVMGSANLGIGF